MESGNTLGKVLKGIVAALLTILTLCGFQYNFKGNWLVSIAVVVGIIIILYKWGLKKIGEFLWEKKWRTIGSLICGFYVASFTPDEAGVLQFIETFLAGFVVGEGFLFFMAKPILFCVRMLKYDVLHGSGGSYSGSSSTFGTYGSDKWEREQQEADRARREADQRAKERYDARTNELKAEYDARAADGWGGEKTVRHRILEMMLITGESSRKNIRVKIGLDPVRSGLFL